LEVTVHLVTHRRDASHRKKSLRNKKARASNESSGAYEGGDEWDWYDAHREEINAEFLELLEASVLSRMFGKEIEDFHKKTNPSIFPAVDDEVGGVASKNKAGSKRKRKGNTATGKKQPKSKQKRLAAIANKDDDKEGDQKPDKDIYFSFGELIQLAYKKQPIRDGRSSRTILFRSKQRNDGISESPVNEGAKEGNAKTKEAGSFHDRKKLSHRLLVWISKSDEAASASRGGDMAADSCLGGGMYRPEMIPISSLFRKPKEFM